MKRRNWVLIVFCVVGVSAFVLSRTVWGPPSKAMAIDNRPAPSRASEEMSDAQRRYMTNQPRHWRYLMLKRN